MSRFCQLILVALVAVLSASLVPADDPKPAVPKGAEKAVAALNTLVSSDIPRGYRDTAKKEWTRQVKGVVAPGAALR